MAGFFGALPGAGTTMKTVTSVRSGGRTPVAGALCTNVIPIVGLGLAPLVEPIPLAVVAGVLIRVGWYIVDWRIQHCIPRLNRSCLVVMLSVLYLTNFGNLIITVAIGLITGRMAHAYRLERQELDTLTSVSNLDSVLSRAEIPQAEIDRVGARAALAALSGTLTATSSHNKASIIGLDTRQLKAVVIGSAGVKHVDASAAAVFGQLSDVAIGPGTACFTSGLYEDVSSTFRSLYTLDRVPARHVASTLESARQLVNDHVGPPGGSKD